MSTLFFNGARLPISSTRRTNAPYRSTVDVTGSASLSEIVKGSHCYQFYWSKTSLSIARGQVSTRGCSKSLACHTVENMARVIRVQLVLIVAVRYSL